jgi:hypothetical protein
MSLFKELNKNKYIENMRIGARTQLSLLETLNALQQEYEKDHNTLVKEIEKLQQQLKILEAELTKAKGR